MIRARARVTLLMASALSSAAFSTVYHTKDHASNQEVIDKLLPGDAVVFDGSGKGDIAVTKAISDVQFIGGGASWTVQADIVDCAFFWHSVKLNQTGGRIRRCVLYKSMAASGMVFTHADSVSLYYNGNYLWPKWNPDQGQTPQLQFDGFMRGVLVHKAITGLTGYSKDGGTWSFRWTDQPALRINATDEIGNGYGSYIYSPLIWEQTNWMPYHIVRATGLTFAHCNTEYTVWASPIAEIDYGIDCMVLCNGPGGRSNAFNDAYKAIALIQYPFGHVEYGSVGDGAPYRGAIFRMGGQRNKMVGTGSYKQWTIGPKDWLPCQHIEDGVTVRDPFYQEWPGDLGSIGLNFGVYKNTFRMANNGSIETHGAGKYPLEGANIVRPVVMPIPDLRACPPSVDRKDVEDLSGQSASRIATAANAGGSVYVGEGTYTFSSALTDGTVIGAGMDKTILVFPATAENTNRGFVNCTVRGAKWGLKSSGGTLSKTMLKVRFENCEAGLYNGGCWQNDCINGVEFVNCKEGFHVGPEACGEPFDSDKIDVVNCLFRNIEGVGISLPCGTPRNGQNAVLNCSFENVGRPIDIGGGGTHLVQNVTVKNCTHLDGGAAVAVSSRNWGQAVTVSHVDVEHTGSPGGTAISAGGYGAVSHCTVKGYAGKTAVATKAGSAVDHVTADGTLDGGAYVAKSKFSDFEVGLGDSKVAIRTSNANRLADGYAQPLDNTPPTESGNVQVVKKSNDPDYPYYPEYNLITWDHATDNESGIVSYIVYAGGQEVGRTPSLSCNIRTPDYDKASATENVFRDPKVSNAGYTVKPVNGANMLPDGSQAPIRRWTTIRPRFYTDDGREFKQHVVDANGGTIKDTVRNMAINWSATTGSPILETPCTGASPANNHRAVAEYGVLSTSYGRGAPVFGTPRGRPGVARTARLTSAYFYVPSRTAVRSAAFDLKGRRVCTLYEGMAEAGTHAFGGAMNRLPSGSYVIRLRAADAALATRLVVAK